MSDDLPKSKPPPKPKASTKEAPPKSTAAASKAPASKGGPSAPQIQEEDVGSGLSKEEAEAKVQETFSPESVGKMEEAKWQDK